MDIEVQASEQGKKTCEFRAEVRKVLQILTNSLYTNREIFLRELVSNASDALDKLRFRQNGGEVPVEPELPLEIRIHGDSEKKVLTVQDNGLGMNADELADNLGIIARSGSESFLAQLAEQSGSDGEKKPDASQIIGRFGVGFYSVFMVASKVEVFSRPAFGEGSVHVWESDGLGTYSVSQAPSSDLKRGTKIVIYLKDDASEYAEKYRLESVIRKHSAFVPFPVFVDEEHVNTQTALWREPKTQVKPEQYVEFYKSYTYDSADPLSHLHISVDSPVQFSALLFIPDSKDSVFLEQDQEHWGIDLYSRRVLIQTRNKDLVPDFFAFLKGVVDTEDLPLNISRETLQENVVLRKINQTLVKQLFNHLEKMAKDKPEDYKKFWKHHSIIFKRGCRDYANQERIAGLLRFNSSTLESAEDLCSLDEYMSRAPEGQKTFWFLSAPGREAARLSPRMDIFRKKGIEVLFFYEGIDEFAISDLQKYKEWEFKSIENAKEEDLKDFADKEEEKEKPAPLSDDEAKTFDGLVKRIKEILGDKVKDVVASNRLSGSAACLASEDGMTSSMEKMMRYMRKDDSLPVKVLEINKDHPLLRAMLRIFKADSQDRTLESMVQSLFDSSVLMDGYIKDPQEVAARSAKLLEQAASWYAEVRKF